VGFSKATELRDENENKKGDRMIPTSPQNQSPEVVRGTMLMLGVWLKQFEKEHPGFIDDIMPKVTDGTLSHLAFFQFLQGYISEQAPELISIIEAFLNPQEK
jgi:hypothetical protein